MSTIPTEEPHEPLAADTFDDGDSAISTPVSAGLTSLRSSVLKFQEENGRTYHSLSGGKYYLPNDDRENERLDLMHNLWLLTLRGELGLSPKAIDWAKRVLDAGRAPVSGLLTTPTYIQSLKAQIIGVDLSPIRPSLVPPNCLFELDDLEKDWTWALPFDLIFSRYLAGCLADPQDYVNKAFDNLAPGGYIEIQDVALPYASDDGTLTEDNILWRVSKLAVEAGDVAGRPFAKPLEYKSFLERAGFVDIVVRRLKFPLNQWPKDPHYKEIGAWTQENLHNGIEGIMMALFTRSLGWKQNEVVMAAMEFRNALKDRRTHAYVPVFVVYGRKPGDEHGTAETTAKTTAETIAGTTAETSAQTS